MLPTSCSSDENMEPPTHRKNGCLVLHEFGRKIGCLELRSRSLVRCRSACFTKHQHPETPNTLPGSDHSAVISQPECTSAVVAENGVPIIPPSYISYFPVSR